MVVNIKGILRTAVFCYLLILTEQPISAHSIIPLLWQEMAVDCDFAGIVECTAAGGVIAEYKVIERWKGLEHDGHIRIEMETKN